MHARQRQLPLVVGMIASVLLHIAVLFPLFFAMLTTASDMGSSRGEFTPDDFFQEEETPPDEIELGIDESEASTLTWIGYEEYQEHLANLSEVEQAAFDLAQAGSGPQPTPLKAESEGQGKPSESVDDKPAGPSPAEPKDATPDKPQADQSPVSADDLPILKKNIEGPPTGGQPDITSGERATEPTPPKPKAKPESDGKKPDQSPTKPATGGPGGPAQGEKPSEEKPKTADVADKQSDATSIIEVKVKNLGKPIARQGLDLKPKRPTFTALTLVTSAPRNPLVLIRFANNGVPTLGTRVVESSGDTRIDNAIDNSLYGWRARGKKLKDLKEGETVDVRLRILLR